MSTYRERKTPFQAPRTPINHAGFGIAYAIDAAINHSNISLMQPVRLNPKPFRAVLPISYRAFGSPQQVPRANPKPNTRIYPWSQAYAQGT